MAKLHKNFGTLAGVASTIATLFPTVWGVIASAVAATALAFWAVGIKWIESAAVQSVVLSFLAFLWTFIGIAWLICRNKPIQVFPFRDYRYGLTFQSVFANLDLRHDEAALQISIAFQNYSPGPLRYTVEQFQVRIDTRSLPDDEDKKTHLSL